MKSESLHEIKKELQLLSAAELSDLCISLAKYKKDNKEYLGYLLFQSQDKNVFAEDVKVEIDLAFAELRSQANLYFVKKSLRKISRLINKYNKYLGDKALAAELLIYFCKKILNSGIPFKKSQQMINMYEQQLKKINTLISTLHEDLQSDYANDLETISDF